MPKRLKKKRPVDRTPDANVWAHRLVDQTTELDQPPAIAPAALSAYMAAIGRKGGRTSGRKRMQNLSDEQRREIASKAARAMWAKRRKR